jgi:abortive infection bacteriophage resistance protein
LNINVQRSNEVFVGNYKRKYGEEERLPIWMATEVITFGSLSTLYRGLLKHDRRKIAVENYGINETALTSWMHVLVYMRNLCAHHSRVWNRTLGISPKVPNKMDSWENICNGIFVAISEHPQLDVGQMGFPKNWKELLRK